MKKVIALVMCVAMIACAVVTVAADEVAATFTVATVEGNKGDVVTVDLTIAEKGTRIGAIGFLFDYDTDYLKFIENPEDGVYFVTGEAINGGMGVGNEDTMALQIASVNGFFKAGTVVTLCFEVIEEIPAGEIAAVNCTVDPEVTVKPNEGDNTYAIAVINGGVKAPAAEIVDGGEDGETGTTVVPTTPTVTVTDTDHDPMGDASAVAVAAGLCAVMAAAFVFTKKAR